MAKALGLIETMGMVAAVEAMDICLKAANVQSIGDERVEGGLVTVKIVGEVGAVKAAVDAAASALQNMGGLVSAHVIPRPAVDIEKMLYPFNPPANTPIPQDDNIEEQAKEAVTPEEPSEAKKTEPTEKREVPVSVHDLNEMKVVDLRKLARSLSGIPMSHEEIKFAKKDEIIKAILEAYSKGEGKA